MFTDESLEPVEFKSTWKKERLVADNSVQTKNLEFKDRGLQSVKRSEKEIQTEEDIPEDIQLYEDDSPELLEFLRKIEPLVGKELQKNIQSHAFDGYTVRWEEETDTVTCVHTLINKESNQEIPVTEISWNCTGAVIAVSYGRVDHEDWCNHVSALCTWNLDRRIVDHDKPNVTIDQTSCLMCIAWHPLKPSWIAGGTFNGEVIIWDIANPDNMLVSNSGIGDDSHSEPVASLQWITDSGSKGNKFNLMSVGYDGKILVWQLVQQKLKLVKGSVILTESLPRQLRRKGLKHHPMGLSCVSFNRDDETTFVVGSLYGGIYRCNTKTRGTPAGSEVHCSVPLESSVDFTFAVHRSSVRSVKSSPYHRNLFLSCSIDGSIRIYSLIEKDPILTLEPNAGSLYASAWSPVRPVVIGAGTESGKLLLYDLGQDRSLPIWQLNASAKGKAVYALQFNEKRPKILATGDETGAVMVWKLNDSLTEQTPRDQELLNDIADSHFD